MIPTGLKYGTATVVLLDGTYSVRLGIGEEVWAALHDLQPPVQVGDVSRLTPRQQALHRVASLVLAAFDAWAQGIQLWNKERFSIEPEFAYYELVSRIEEALTASQAVAV